jgi:hypothetical protein
LAARVSSRPPETLPVLRRLTWLTAARLAL